MIKKIVLLFVIGIMGIIIFLQIQKILTGDGSISLTCKNAHDTITVKFDPTSDKMISATKKDGSEYKIENIDERIEKIGVLKYIEEFSRNFEAKQGGACFKR